MTPIGSLASAKTRAAASRPLGFLPPLAPCLARVAAFFALALLVPLAGFFAPEDDDDEDFSAEVRAKAKAERARAKKAAQQIKDVKKAIRDRLSVPKKTLAASSQWAIVQEAWALARPLAKAPGTLAQRNAADTHLMQAIEAAWQLNALGLISQEEKGYLAAEAYAMRVRMYDLRPSDHPGEAYESPFNSGWRERWDFRWPAESSYDNRPAPKGVRPTVAQLLRYTRPRTAPSRAKSAPD